jgi:hypothetical protein
MKNLMMGLLMLFATSAYSHEDEIIQCNIRLRPIGIWYTQCPRGTLTDGVDVFVGQIPNARVRVNCVKPEAICTKIRK